MLLAAATASAGRIVPLSMQPVDNDMRGQFSQVKDKQGRDCALVKVKIPFPGAMFDGHVKAEDRTGEYFVYVEDGNKYLEIRFPGCDPVMVNFVELMGSAVKAPRTYELTIDRDALGYTLAGNNIPADPGKQYAVFVLDPEPDGNATLSINGSTIDFRKGKASALLEYGTYDYRIVATGYHDYTGQVDVLKGDKTEQRITLRSTMGTVTIHCPTPCAKVTVNDEVLTLDVYGTWSGHLAAMSYKVEASHPSYRPHSEYIDVTEGEQLTVNIPELTPITGNLPVNIEPIGAEIFVDNQKYGTSPLIITDLLIGSHVITCTAEGCDKREFNVTVTEGNNPPLSGELTASGELPASKEPVFEVAEQEPQFPGGDAALNQFISMNLRYPAEAVENNIQGRVIIRFIVEKDGSITNPIVWRSVDRDLDKEALRVVRSMPRWKPGMNNGVPVRCYIYQPFRFRLQ